MLVNQYLCPNCFGQGTFITQEKKCVACGYLETERRDGKMLPYGFILREKYYIGRILGAGGFGITYLTCDWHTGKKLAVKEYFPESWAVRQKGGTSLMPVSQDREREYRHGLDVFVEEAKILYGLKKNQAVVDVLEFFQENQTAYLVMEYVPGMTLSQKMKQNKQTFSVEYANQVIRILALALADIHEMGLLHRDISPDNIMLLPDGNIRLIDFGATRQFVVNETTDMSVLVKPGFAPVEQYSRSGKQGPWSDVYALAATYYYLVSGRKPVTATDRYVGARQKDLSDAIDGFPAKLSKVIAHAMELDYKKRPQSMKAFVKELDAAVGNVVEKRKLPHPYIYGRIGGQIKKWRFECGTSIVIGRNKHECDICIEDDKISGSHCRIGYDWQRGVFQIIDMSKNGTYVRGKLIGKGRYAEIMSGESIFLLAGGYQFILEAKNC